MCHEINESGFVLGTVSNRRICFAKAQVCLRATLFFFLSFPNKGSHLSSQTLCYLHTLAASHTALGNVGTVPRSKSRMGQCLEMSIGIERNLQSVSGLSSGGTLPIPGQ